ncbi:phage head morphogenesis protein [Methylobacillus sp.]|uniref:phage head morphogenesis protein n=1 Tax=Methylobacillus sp. TaxID=56818 RepID=UPI002FE38A1D
MSLKKKPILLPDFKPSAGIRARYRAELNRLLRSVRNDVMELVKNHKHEIAMDAPTLPQLIDDLMVFWLKRLTELPQVIAREFVTSTASAYDKRFSAALRQHGFTVNLQMTDYTRAAMKAAVGQNVGLIKSIPTEYLADVSKLVWSAVEGGFDLKTLTDNLDHAYHIGRNRCKLIALDQSRKVHAVMEQARRKELGVTRAIWRHSAAAKEPRKSHVAANGKIFDVDKGLYLDGKWVLPGQEIMCGCTSRAIIEF